MNDTLVTKSIANLVDSHLPRLSHVRLGSVLRSVAEAESGAVKGGV